MHRLCREHAFPPRRPNAKPNLHGWLGDGNQLLLKKFIRKETKLIFEFGTWLGKSAMFMLNQQADNPEFQKVVCVDTWEGDWSIKQTDKYKEHLANLYDTFIVNMWEVRDRVVPVRMDGRKAMKYLHSLGLNPDLIYLDMDHSYESAKGDLECLMKYFPDTLILGDDVLYWKGVATAVKEIVKEHNITNLEINKNCYARVPSQYSKRYHLKELITKVIQPKEQYIDYKIGIIVGFHPRSHTRRQLHRFREHMTSFMEQTGVDFKIYVIEQHDQQQELNLGHMYNSGYEIALADGCEKFVFQDIYLLPSKALVPYYRRHNKYPIHLGYHYDKYFYEVYYLGIIMFNKENFELVNGYPINIYGLYGWDYEMVLRIKDAGLKLKLPAEGTVIPNGTHPRINVQEWRKIKTSAIINKHSETWKSNGLKNTFYVRKTNRAHTVKNTPRCRVYTVSIVNYTHYIMFAEDEVWEMEEDVKEEPELCFEMLHTPEPTEGFKDKEWKQLFSQDSFYDLHSDLTLHIYEAAKYSEGTPIFNTRWKKTRVSQSKRQNITQRKQFTVMKDYILYSLNPLKYVDNRFEYLADPRFSRFKVLYIKPMIKLTHTTDKDQNRRCREVNNIKFLLRKQRLSHLEIEFTNVFLSSGNHPLDEHGMDRTRRDDFYTKFENSEDYKKLNVFFTRSKRTTFDLISICSKKINRSREAYNNNLFFQLIVIMNHLQIGGTCILSAISIPQFFQPSFYCLLRTIKHFFKTVKIVRNKYSNLKARKMSIICNGLQHSPDTKKYNAIFFKLYKTDGTKRFFKCSENRIANNSSFLKFIDGQYTKYASGLERLKEFESISCKEQNSIYKKIYDFKTQQMESELDQLFAIST